ncbi:MAG: EcsC family protein [Actinobacteria bacterium]|uniref:EcsC family protein n=1 Tax=Propionicimonas sp. T2.31MG-18 TaxID=3157620 RepID=UPI0035EAE8E5|nr:EcsC family protein [Actinomycetota bacterium]
MANAASDFGKQLVTRTPEVAGGLLRSIVDFAIDGSPAFPGAKATAARSLQSKADREGAIDALVRYHVSMASAQGFMTSVGGLLTLPVGLPANIAGMAVLGVRMIAAIAHLRGYDVDDRRVRAALTLAMLGDDEVRRLVADGKLPSSPLAVATAPVFDPALERTISERVMGSLAGRIGGKHVAVVVVRRIPLVGGGVGAAVDGWLTFGLAAYARREFIPRHQASIPRQ